MQRLLWDGVVSDARGGGNELPWLTRAARENDEVMLEGDIRAQAEFVSQIFGVVA